MREVGKENAAWLARIHARCFERAWSGAEIEKLLDNPAAFALGDEAGFILAWAAAGEAEIVTLAVMPEARRTGVGAALVAAAAKAAADTGATEIHLEVAEDNSAARGLYAKLGFSEAGRRPGYYGGMVNAVIMRRALPL